MRLMLALFGLQSEGALRAQTEEVAVVTSGVGRSMEEATQRALREAVLQAYGAFISSETKVINDRLSSDVIHAIANGHVRRYELLGQAEVADGFAAVTLRVVVSPRALAEYLGNTTNAVAFEGAMLSFELNQRKLNAVAEREALRSLRRLAVQLLPKCIDHQVVKDGAPVVIGEGVGKERIRVPLKVAVTLNSNITTFMEYLLATILAVSIRPEEVDAFQRLGQRTYAFRYLLSERKNWRGESATRTVFFRTSLAAQACAEIFFVDLPKAAAGFTVIDNLGGKWPRAGEYKLGSLDSSQDSLLVLNPKDDAAALALIASTAREIARVEAKRTALVLTSFGLNVLQFHDLHAGENTFRLDSVREEDSVLFSRLIPAATLFESRFDAAYSAQEIGRISGFRVESGNARERVP